MKAKELIKILEAVSPDETVFVSPDAGADKRVKDAIEAGCCMLIVGADICVSEPNREEHTINVTLNIDSAL